MVMTLAVTTSSRSRRSGGYGIGSVCVIFQAGFLTKNSSLIPRTSHKVGNVKGSHAETDGGTVGREQRQNKSNPNPNPNPNPKGTKTKQI